MSGKPTSQQTDQHAAGASPDMARAGGAFPEKLLAGYAAFRGDRLPQDRAIYQDLAENGQRPETMIICCCDSRSAPEAIFSAGPGDLFVVRNVANLVPPHEKGADCDGVSAAIEFALLGLGIKHIVVMGHGSCGGIAAFRQKMTGQAGEPLSAGNFVGKWTLLLEPVGQALQCTGAETAQELQRKLEEQAIRQSVENLTRFPFITPMLESGEVTVHGAWFDIASGDLWTMNESSLEFEQPGG